MQVWQLEDHLTLKASKSTNELMMSKVDNQLKLKSELISEKISSTKRMVEILSSERSIYTDLELKK